MQDDLVSLMTRNLQLSPLPQHPHDVSMPPTPQVTPHQAPITYITQHYHHSAHQAPHPDLPISTVLENAGVNASALLPSQLQLFKNAAPDQQQRLIELWRIAPITYGNQMLQRDLSNWPQTSMEQEEEAARHRWQMLEQEKLKNLCALPAAQETPSHAEPYIVQGYENLPNINGITAPTPYGATPAKVMEYKKSNDPAYNSREWWVMADDEPMEHQYGLLQQMYAHQIDYSTRRKEDGDDEML